MAQSRPGAGTTDRTVTGTGAGTGTGQPVMTAMFRTRDQAEDAYRVLMDRGYDADEISVIMSDETRKRDFAAGTAGGDTELGSKAAEGAGVGGAVGATVGAIAAALAAVGTSVVVPGLGLVIAGPLAAALAGAGAGAITGGLLGALVGAGIPEERAKVYETGIDRGGIVIAVKPRSVDDANDLEREWKRAGGEQVYH
jgi:hypothetical protein